MKYEGFLWGVMFASIAFNYFLLRRMNFLENLFENLASNCLKMAQILEKIKQENEK